MSTAISSGAQLPHQVERGQQPTIWHAAVWSWSRISSSHMRIGDACARLSATVQPVGHIADAVGYNSLANFNRQFRTQTGMTPRQYRNVFRPA